MANNARRGRAFRETPFIGTVAQDDTKETPKGGNRFFPRLTRAGLHSPCLFRVRERESGGPVGVEMKGAVRGRSHRPRNRGDNSGPRVGGDSYSSAKCAQL